MSYGHVEHASADEMGESVETDFSVNDLLECVFLDSAIFRQGI